MTRTNDEAPEHVANQRTWAVTACGTHCVAQTVAVARAVAVTTRGAGLDYSALTVAAGGAGQTVHECTRGTYAVEATTHLGGRP